MAEPLTAEQRLDELLAHSLAHSVVLQELAQALFRADEAGRRVALERATSAFEAAYGAASLDDRASLLIQTGIAEIERLLRPS